MSEEAQQHRKEADQLPEGDIVGILLRQHADITDTIELVKSARGENRVTNFAALAKLLKAHETAEQQVLRPVASDTANPAEAAQRNAEEAEADRALAALTALGADSPDFGPEFAQFAKAVHAHAEQEEHQEFPTLQKALTDQERARLGERFLAAFTAAS